MKLHRLPNWHLAFVGIISGVLLAAGNANCQQLHGKALVRALQRGGYVIVMRHASSPQNPPTKDGADPQNIHLERQLDENGRTTATAFGNAIRRLKIPVGQVLSSPTYRALETARYAQLLPPITLPELGDNGRSMQNTNASQSVWLQKQVTKFPRGSNTILITHQPNIAAAFPQWSRSLSDGEALIFGSDGKEELNSSPESKLTNGRSCQLRGIRSNSAGCGVSRSPLCTRSLVAGACNHPS